jgi:hypothetical protein
MTNLVAKEWSKTRVLAKFRIIKDILYKIESLKTYRLIRDFVRRES